MARLKSLPSEISAVIVIKNVADEERTLGLSLNIPEALKESMRGEVLRTFLHPKRDTLFRDLLEGFGFVILHLPFSDEEHSLLSDRHSPSRTETYLLDDQPHLKKHNPFIAVFPHPSRMNGVTRISDGHRIHAHRWKESSHSTILVAGTKLVPIKKSTRINKLKE